MSKMAEAIRKELSKVPDRQPTLKGDNVWIRCPNPEHAGGQESSPSMAVNLANENYKVGMCHCFGCGITKPWADVAKLLGIRTLKNIVRESGPVITDKKRVSMLGKDVAERQKVGPPTMFTQWPSTEDWRGIDGRLLQNFGAVLAYDVKINDTRIALPVQRDEAPTEWVYGVLKRFSKTQLAYINTSGSWADSALFAYDYARMMLGSMDYRVLLVGEGPRDALNSIQHGLPAVALLGAGSAKSKDKQTMILDLDPDIVILGLDNDSAGQKAEWVLKRALGRKSKVMIARFSEGVDPGKLSRKAVKTLHRKALLRLEVSKDDIEEQVERFCLPTR